ILSVVAGMVLRVLGLDAVPVALRQRELRGTLRLGLRLLAAVERLPRRWADNPVGSQSTLPLEALHLVLRERANIAVGDRPDSLLGALRRLTLLVQLHQRGLARHGRVLRGGRLHLDVASVADVLVEQLDDGVLALAGGSPRELDMDVVSVRGDARVPPPARVRVSTGPDLPVPDDALDAQLFRLATHRLSKLRAVLGRVRPDAEVSGTTLTMQGRCAATTHRPTVVDPSVQAALGGVPAQEPRHRPTNSRLGSARARLCPNVTVVDCHQCVTSTNDGSSGSATSSGSGSSAVSPVSASSGSSPSMTPRFTYLPDFAGTSRPMSAVARTTEAPTSSGSGTNPVAAVMIE